jgi:phage gp29-like protein
MGVFSWLAGKFGRAQALAPIDAVSEPALYYQHTRIGGRLTPADVSEILREVDTGYMYRFVDLFNESRQKDCQLQAVCATREMAVGGMRFEVLPASEKRQDKKIADFTRDWLTNFGTGAATTDEDEPRDLRTLISHLAGANLFGYSFAETLFARDGAYVVPTGCVPIAQRRFVYELATSRLRFYDMFGDIPLPGLDLMADFPGRFVLHTPRVNGDVAYREGLARPLVWAALFRSWSIADWMKLAELSWKPWRIGSYTAGKANKEDKTTLIRALQSLTTDNVAWIPDSTKIDIQWAKGNKGESAHAAMANFLGAEMSKCVLGATLTVEQGNVGSRALGDVHNEVRHDIRDADSTAIAGSIRRTLIAPTVRLNFGRDATIPGFALHAEKQVDLVQLSLAVLNLANAGLRIPADWARGLAGIPTPKDADEIIGAGKVSPDQLAASLRVLRDAGLLPSNDVRASAA